LLVRSGQNNCGKDDFFLAAGCFFSEFRVTLVSRNDFVGSVYRLIGQVTDGFSVALDRPDSHDAAGSSRRFTAAACRFHDIFGFVPFQLWQGYIFSQPGPVIASIFQKHLLHTQAVTRRNLNEQRDQQL
jgi:hypothetical protein